MSELKGRARLRAALTEPQRPHPILSGLQFAHATNTPSPDGSQGASLNVNTGRLMQIGRSDVWMVGGHPGRDGSPIPTVSVPGRSITVGQAVDHVQRVAREGRGSRPAAAGSWYNQKTKAIDLDASTPVVGREDAVSLWKTRPNEDAIFHLKTGEELSK